MCLAPQITDLCLRSTSREAFGCETPVCIESCGWRETHGNVARKGAVGCRLRVNDDLVLVLRSALVNYLLWLAYTSICPFFCSALLSSGSTCKVLPLRAGGRIAAITVLLD